MKPEILVIQNPKSFDLIIKLDRPHPQKGRSHFADTQSDRINPYVQPKATYAIALKFMHTLFYAGKLAGCILS